MSCFFCDSNYHVSHYCDKYVTDESRRKIMLSKNCCPNCLTFLDSGSYCLKCKYSRKCYICFSEGHFTVYCPDRSIESTMFCPKIDDDLIYRFLQLLEKEEKMFLPFSYPNALNILKLKPVKIRYTEKYCYSKKQLQTDSDFIVADECSVQNSTSSFSYYFDARNLNPPIFYIKSLEICTEISSQELFMLLSSKTTRIHFCSNVICPTFVFREILENAPKLEDADVSLTNIVADNSWPDDILNFNKADTLRHLRFSIPADLNFNVASLLTLLKKTSVKLHLFITLPNNACIQHIIETLRNDLSHHFIPLYHCPENARIIFTLQLGQNGSTHFDCYTLAES